MKIEIINKIKNPFLNREEMIVEIVNESAPTIDSIIEAVGKDKELTVVKKVDSNFGVNKFSSEVFVYDSKESREKVETIPKKVKKKMEEERKKAEEEAKKKEATPDSGSEASEDTSKEELSNGESGDGVNEKVKEVKEEVKE